MYIRTHATSSFISRRTLGSFHNLDIVDSQSPLLIGLLSLLRSKAGFLCCHADIIYLALFSRPLVWTALGQGWLFICPVFPLGLVSSMSHVVAQGLQRRWTYRAYRMDMTPDVARWTQREKGWAGPGWLERVCHQGCAQITPETCLYSPPLFMSFPLAALHYYLFLLWFDTLPISWFFSSFLL